MLEAFSLALSVTAPVFILVLLGTVLKYFNYLDDVFVAKASELIFYLFLPCLFFFTLLDTDLSTFLSPSLSLVLVLFTIAFYLFLELLVKFIPSLKSVAGEFCQSSFRSNLAFIGLSFCAGAYGEEGLARAAVLVAFVTVVYNILSVLTLERHLNSSNKSSFLSLVQRIAKNPLVVAIVLGVACNPLAELFPKPIKQSGSYLAQITLPMALMCIGASLSIKSMTAGQSKVIALVVFLKLLLMPLLAVVLVWYLNYSAMDIGIVFLLLSAPTASASFVMVAAMGGDARLTANFIAATTVGSLFTVSLGFAALNLVVPAG
ncbi:AEC family transporter [uncultured Pseudoteredinibacter sp.]|uniref:AEC family transporter n=1 Tax=uncultured Pseudoteredinibacter sp. TaxID=1641701 RepID=UPI002637BCF7|nr:AEC family transporter [uncultured Pseudoteredinibacter sp.]